MTFLTCHWSHSHCSLAFPNHIANLQFQDVLTLHPLRQPWKQLKPGMSARWHGDLNSWLSGHCRARSAQAWWTKRSKLVQRTHQSSHRPTIRNRKVAELQLQLQEARRTSEVVILVGGCLKMCLYNIDSRNGCWHCCLGFKVKIAVFWGVWSKKTKRVSSLRVRSFICFPSLMAFTNSKETQWNTTTETLNDIDRFPWTLWKKHHVKLEGTWLVTTDSEWKRSQTSPEFCKHLACASLICPFHSIWPCELQDQYVSTAKQTPICSRKCRRWQITAVCRQSAPFCQQMRQLLAVAKRNLRIGCPM